MLNNLPYVYFNQMMQPAVLSSCLYSMSRSMVSAWCLFAVILLSSTSSPSTCTSEQLHCILYLYLHSATHALSIYPVILTASPNSLCPGDTVVLTCVTDTGRLDWTFGKTVTLSFYKADQIGIPLNKNFFTVILYNITGDDNNTFWSTATVSHHVPLNYSETVSCSDGPGGNITKYTIRVGKIS